MIKDKCMKLSLVFFLPIKFSAVAIDM